jgi:hypothetical protein
LPKSKLIFWSNIVVKAFTRLSQSVDAKFIAIVKDQFPNEGDIVIGIDNP